MKIRIIVSTVCLASLLLGSVGVVAEASQVESGIEFEVIGGNEATITGCAAPCSFTDLVIPDALGGFPVTKISANSFSTGVHDVKGALTLPTSLVEIGAGAFADNGITSIIWPSNAIKVGASAFAYNQLKDLTIPQWMGTVPDEAFRNNPLTALSISEGVKVIGKRSFYMSTGLLSELILPESLTKLGYQSLGVKGRTPVWPAKAVLLNLVFLGTVPTFPTPRYRFLSDVDDGENVEIWVDKKYYSGFEKLTYEYTRKNALSFNLTWARNPRLLFTPPAKPAKVTWAFMDLPAIPNSSVKRRNAYVAQISGNTDTFYDVTNQPNFWPGAEEELGRCRTMMYSSPPAGFISSYDTITCEFPTKTNLDYVAFRPVRGATQLSGEIYEGSLNPAHKALLPKYKCTSVDMWPRGLSCKKVKN